MNSPLLNCVIRHFQKNLNNQIIFLSFWQLYFISYILFGGGFGLADQQSQPVRSLQLFIIWKKIKIFYFSIRSHFFFQKQTQYLGLFHLLLMTCFLSEINSCDYVRSFCSEFIIYTKST